MKKYLIATLLGTLLGAGFSMSAHAQIFSWKDSSGRVHYSDQPPPGVDARPTRTRKEKKLDEASASEPKAESKPKGWTEKELEFRQRRAEQAEREQKQKQEEARKKEKDAYCQDLRRQLGLVESGARMGRANDKGEMEALGDEERKKEGERLRGQLSRDCK